MIGAIIMVHGDDSGLVLPPKVAPVQTVVIPIQQAKEGVEAGADNILSALKAAGLRAKVDKRGFEALVCARHYAENKQNRHN